MLCASLRISITDFKVLNKQYLMTTIFSAPKMDLVFIILKREKLRQRGALCCIPDLSVNTMEETSRKKQACQILSSTTPIAFFQNTKKNTEHAENAHKHHMQSAFQ